jgi:hypothetical protein
VPGDKRPNFSHIARTKRPNEVRDAFGTVNINGLSDRRLRETMVDDIQSIIQGPSTKTIIATQHRNMQNHSLISREQAQAHRHTVLPVQFCRKIVVNTVSYQLHN